MRRKDLRCKRNGENRLSCLGGTRVEFSGGVWGNERIDEGRGRRQMLCLLRGGAGSGIGKGRIRVGKAAVELHR